MAWPATKPRRSPKHAANWQSCCPGSTSARRSGHLRVDRAEPAQSNLLRPDNAFLAEQGRLLVGWPTKLALAPDFADRVCARLEEDGIRPSEHAALPQLPRPPLAEPAWEVAFA